MESEIELYVMRQENDIQKFYKHKDINTAATHIDFYNFCKFKDMLTTTTTHLNFITSFKTQKNVKITFNLFNNKTKIDKISDIESITLHFIYSELNESKIRNKIKDEVKHIVDKRTDEVKKLKEERNQLQDELDNGILLSEEELCDLRKEVELINNQIFNHHKEIKNIISSVDGEIEVGEEVTKYDITIYPNTITHIRGLPDQIINFSLLWVYENKNEDEDDIMKPNDFIIENLKRVKVTYDTL